MNIRPRPYFFPADLDWDDFPDPVKLAIDEIIQPAYEELVLAAPTALERNAGGTLTILMVIELVDQFNLGGQLAHMLRRGADRSIPPEGEDIDRLLKVIRAKERATMHYMKIVEFCAAHRPAPSEDSTEDSHDPT